ncbi:MAG: translation initiation factor IF-2 [Desulfobacterales bacterium]|nr:translation initiation factor IF-2 [Desulfobacterales bacterium]
MAKIRVYELSKELNIGTKELLDKLKEMNIDAASHMSSLDEDSVSRIKSELQIEPTGKVENKLVVIRRKKKRSIPEDYEHENIEEISNFVLSEDKKESIQREDITDQLIKIEKTQVDNGEESTSEKLSETILENKICEVKKDISVEEKGVVEEIPEIKGKEIVEDKQNKINNDNLPETKDEISVVTPAKVIEDRGKKDIKQEKRFKKGKKFPPAKILKLPDENLPQSDTDEENNAALKKNTDRPDGYRDKKQFVRDKVDHTRATTPKEQQNYDKDTKKYKKKFKVESFEKEDKYLKKKFLFNKKDVVETSSIFEDEHFRIKKYKKQGQANKEIPVQKSQITTPKAIKRRIKVDETIVLGELAKRMGVKSAEIIQKLMGLGIMVTVNQTIDFETASLVSAEFNYEIEKANFEEKSLLKVIADNPVDLIKRPPVVTIMGHVDHGKTSLLDAIRKSRIAEKEAGGITQHIGAYNVETERGTIAFLDTPGHEAFTAMRARGAKVTDIVILVVAADDGVMPQTIEAINHSKVAKVPIIVAVNKIDKAGADPERVKRELSDHGIISEDWGGENIFVNVSAKERTGINELLEMILLQSDVLELKANPNKSANGHVVEANLDTGKGPVATVLVQEGTLKTGDYIVCGVNYGKIRAMLNDMGEQIDSAGPSVPVKILGLSGVPMAGDELIVFEDEKTAKQVSEHRTQKSRSKELEKHTKMSLEKLYEKMQEGEVKGLNIILKADVHGSIEALRDSLVKLSNAEVKINVIHAATGSVIESDITLASVSDAIIIGFNVRPSPKVMEFALQENVDMRFYDIIYNVIQDVKDAMVGLMKSEFKEKSIGMAEVREVFHIPKIGSIAGCYVIQGKIERGKQIRLLRDGIIIYNGKISSLKRFKDDAKEVLHNFECGIGLENYNDIKQGDIIECYYLEEIKPTFNT